MIATSPVPSSDREQDTASAHESECVPERDRFQDRDRIHDVVAFRAAIAATRRAMDILSDPNPDPTDFASVIEELLVWLTREDKGELFDQNSCFDEDRADFVAGLIQHEACPANVVDAYSSLAVVSNAGSVEHLPMDRLPAWLRGRRVHPLLAARWLPASSNRPLLRQRHWTDWCAGVRWIPARC